MTNALLSILENIASLNQAQQDMTRAQSLSMSVTNKQFRTPAQLQTIINVIDQTSVSSNDVSALNLNAQKARFTAEEARTDTQQAL